MPAAASPVTPSIFQAPPSSPKERRTPKRKSSEGDDPGARRGDRLAPGTITRSRSALLFHAPAPPLRVASSGVGTRRRKHAPGFVGAMLASPRQSLLCPYRKTLINFHRAVLCIADRGQLCRAADRRLRPHHPSRTFSRSIHVENDSGTAPPPPRRSRMVSRSQRNIGRQKPGNRGTPAGGGVDEQREPFSQGARRAADHAPLFGAFHRQRGSTQRANHVIRPAGAAPAAQGGNIVRRQADGESSGSSSRRLCNRCRE